MLPCPSATVKQHTTENDPPVKQLTTVNDQPVNEPTTANDQSMMEQLKNVRANRKYVLTVAYKATKRTTLELNRDAVLAHRQLLMTAFKLFEKASNEYLEVLDREEDVQCAEDYYDIEEKVYIENLKILNSAMDELSRYSYIIDSSSNCVSAMSPLLNMSTAVMLPACEPELSYLQQNEPSESVDEHIPLPDIHPDSSVSPSCLEHIPVSESKVTKLSQKEQSKCMASMCDEHISSPGVVSESPISPSPLDICIASHRSNYHHQQTVNVSQCSMELQDDHTVMSLHDIPIGDSETMLKQVSPCPISAQSLATDPIMCLKYNANNPPYIDTVNDSGMLVGQNLPRG